MKPGLRVSRAGRGWAASLRGSAMTLAVTAACGCSTGSPPANQGAETPNTPSFRPVVCSEDRVREFYCDGLLPMSTALGAPDPYGSCPAGIESPPGLHKERERVARFDAAYTEWSRERAKPGHTCCYSWCSSLQVRDPDEVAPYAGCDVAGSLRETFCMPELESGTSRPGPRPFDRCPVALRPPEVIHFSVPRAAPLDLEKTREKRAQGARECCYGWCSRMPSGIVTERAR